MNKKGIREEVASAYLGIYVKNARKS